MTDNSITIGRLAAAAGVHVETVRYYQRRGLLREPEKPLGGIRRYGQDDLTQLRFIRRAQSVGFTLDEIRGLLRINGNGSCEQTRILVERKLADIRQRLTELRRLERDILHLVTKCRKSPSKHSCPTLDLLRRA